MQTRAIVCKRTIASNTRHPCHAVLITHSVFMCAVNLSATRSRQQSDSQRGACFVGQVHVCCTYGRSLHLLLRQQNVYNDAQSGTLSHTHTPTLPSMLVNACILFSCPRRSCSAWTLARHRSLALITRRRARMDLSTTNWKNRSRNCHLH